MSERYVFMAYPVTSGWVIEYPLDSAGNFLDCRKATPAAGIIELLPQVTTANNVTVRLSEIPLGERVYEFECEPNGAFIFTTLAINGKVEYSTVDESAAYGRWELAQALLETEVNP